MSSTTSGRYRGRHAASHGGRMLSRAGTVRALRRAFRRSPGRAAAALLAVAAPVAALTAGLGGTAADAAVRSGTAGVSWHKLALLNGWRPVNPSYNTGSPSYAISGGMVYLSGALTGGSTSEFAVLPKAARPAHWMYQSVYSFGNSYSTLLIKPDGEMEVYGGPVNDSTVFTSLATVSYPAASTTQHKLALLNGWISGQHQFGTGPAAYSVRNGIVRLSGSAQGGTGSDIAQLPAGARPSHMIYRAVYTLGGALRHIYIEPSGFVGGYDSGTSQGFTSLEGVSFPAAGVAQHAVSLVNGWKSAQSQYGTGGLSYAVEGGIVYLSGSMTRPSGTSELCAKLPLAARPAHVLYITVYTRSDYAGTMRIMPDGRVFVSSAVDPTASPGFTSAAAISYPRNS